MPTPPQRAPLTKKQLKADHPTWCPGCGDFAVLASFFNVVQKLGIPHEKIVCVAGIGCSSRIPYFINAHGIHFIHGRAIPLATGISLSRPDLHVFVFGGDGDGYSIGGNHLTHAGRKNINLSYVIMDNQVYGLTKNQTSPTTPIGHKSKTDPFGSIDRPINPMAHLVSSGASFVARTHATQVKHMNEMFERAILHPGFAVVETLSECTMFYPKSFDSSIPRKGGNFELIDEAVHDKESLADAMALTVDLDPGQFGVYFETHRATKNELEGQLVTRAQAATKGMTGREILRQRFAAMR
jgi:2-oxoglutarate ferredoxin oxidoreductase subunit beta